MPETVALPSRYQDLGLLGTGGMGEVRLVFDAERGAELALKRCTAVDEGARFLFKQEFWAMASLPHPHLVAAYDYGELADGSPYFTMERVPVAPPALPQSEAEVRRWLPAIASALAYLHGRGFLHGDLKPENLHTGETPKLMDLGLLERAGRVGGEIRGSLHYMAPEAIRQGALDARTDLYGLGAVLYHVLSGHPPFEDPTTLGLLHAQLERKPEPLAGELGAAVMKLLAKDPRQRFASVAALMEALGLHAEGARAQGLLGSPLVGRDDLLDRLAAAPGPHWLVGEPGAGKTRLLAALKARAQVAGRPVLAAAGAGVDAAPYQALLPWLRALIAMRPPVLERLAPVLVRLLPELDVPAAAALEGPQERVRLHGALAELAAEALPGPALWLLDDVDRLDAASRELVAALGRVERPWSFVGAGTEAPGEALPPLTEAQLAELAGHLLGQADVPPEVLERLGAFGGHLPGPVATLLEHWIQAGSLVREGGRWVAAPGAGFELPGGLAGLAEARLAALSPDARRLARVAALLGPAGELGAALALAGLPEAAGFAAIAELDAAGLLLREGERYRFARPAQAEALAAGLAPAEARALHTRAAEWLAARAGEAPPLDVRLAIARHHLAGSDPAAGVPWAIAAAREAVTLYAVPQAEALVAAARPHAAAPLELDLLQGYILRFKGDIEGALALYEGTLLPALAGPALVEHTVTYGALLQMRGRYPDAMAAFTRAINLADELEAPLQAIRARLFAGRVAYFSGQTSLARTPLAAAIRRARALVARATGQERDQAENLLGRALGFFGLLEATTRPGAEAAGLAMLEEAIAIDTRLGDLRELHEAYNNQGNAFMAMGRYPEAAEVFGRCLQLCERMGSANEAIFAHLNAGSALLELGEVARAAAHARTATQLARQQARKFPEGYALALAGMTDLATGEPGVGLVRLEEGLALAREIANKYLELNILAYQAQALVLAGQWERAHAVLAEARALAEATQNAELAPKLERMELALAVLEGAPDAGERLAAAVDAARAAKRPAALAHLLRWQAAWRLGRAQHLDAERALTEALGHARELGLSRLLAELRLLGGQLTLAGQRRDQAAVHFRAALDLAEAGGDRLTAALARAALGRAARDVAMQREAARALEQMLDGLEPAAREAFTRFAERAEALAPFAAGPEGGVSLARVRHLTGLIALLAGRQDLFALMRQALAALVELVEAERGFLVLYDGFEVQERLFVGADPDADAFSNGVAEQVLWTGQPVFVEDASQHADLAGRESIQALALRAVVGLPLSVDGQVIGVMIADSRQIKQGWGEAEMEVALALAQAVAMAIAHARQADADARELERLRLVQRVALAIAGEREPARLAELVLAEARALVDAERGFLLLGSDADRLRLPDGSPPVDTSQSVCRWVLEQREPLHSLDVQSDDAFANAQSVMALGLRTVVGVPVCAGETCFGLMYLDSRRMGSADPRALASLSALGELLGAHLAPSTPASPAHGN